MVHWVKAVDGQNPFAGVPFHKMMFGCRIYVSATNHVYGTNIILVSKRFWDKLFPRRAEDDAGRRRSPKRYQLMPGRP